MPEQAKTITWLHISDLHLRASRAYDANVVLRALLRDVAERIQQDDLRPDFIAVSGDVAFSGQPAEYDLAGHFFDDLLRVTGLGKGRLFLVPGNHDVDRGLITRGAQAIGDSLQDRDGANAVLAATDDRRLMMARFQGYAAFVNGYLAGHLTFDDEHYCYVRTLDLPAPGGTAQVAGRRVVLLGLNSAWLSASIEDRAKGLLIGERQARAVLDAAEEALKDTGGGLTIALLHHPFDWLREFDQADSAAMLLDRCAFLLHGHLHQMAATQLVSPDGAATVLAGGACYETRQYPNMVNWVRLNPASGTGTVYLRRYSDARGGFWAKDTLTYRNVPDGVVTFRLSGVALPPVERLPALPVVDAGSQSPAPGQTSPAGDFHLDPDNPPIAAIRSLLLSAFTAETLRRFCQDSLYPNFGYGHGLADMADELIEYCRTQLLWDELLAAVAEISPKQYERFELRLRGQSAESAQVSPAPARPAARLPDLRRRLALFDDAQLDAFCLDYFPEVYDLFGRGMRRDEKTTLLLDHLRRAGDYGPLLAALQAVSA